MTKTLFSLMLTMLFLLSGCGSSGLDHYKGTKPQADLKAFFTGPVKAWGIIQDWRGDVVSRFDVDMQGSWKGNIGTLEEDFVYYDGSTQRRVWTITQKKDGKYIGTASDIIGEAEGATNGSALRWAYSMDVPVDDTTYRLYFDDWMWMMNDGVLINRSYLKKFGFTVAELTLFMQKQTEKPSKLENAE
ncbi:MAG: DUF3833 domain-containing protein [Pseudomonadota bacterium]